MKVTLRQEGVSAPSRHWVVCPGRSMVTLDVEWKPGADTKKRTDPPQCRLNYLTAPGLVPGGLPGSIMLRPETFEDGHAEYHGSKTIQVPSFHPLRVRIELRPPYGTPHSHIAYIIPTSSARVSTALVVLSIVAVALVAVRTLTTLLLTPMQTAAGLGAMALGLLALFVLRSALSTLRTDDLPFLGITYVIYRSLGACALVFAGLIGLIQQCVVVIDNQTDDDVEFNFSWRGERDVVAAHSEISVIPPNRQQLVEGLLDTLAEGDRDRALCIKGADRANHACPPDQNDADLVEDWRLHPFTPTTLTLGCGRRWGMGLRGFNVLPDGQHGVRIEGEDVWLEPGSDCGKGGDATLWYRDDDRNAAHYVRYPWSPQTITDFGTLWVSLVENPSGRETNLSMRSVHRASGDDGGPRFEPETRIRLSGAEEVERSWPLMSLPADSRSDVTVEIGEQLPKLTDPFSAAATLGCTRAQGRGTGLQAIRIGYKGPVGGVTTLEVSAGLGLSWKSKWQLQGGSSHNVAVPWICSAFPGTDPRLSSKESFSSEMIQIRLGPPGANESLQLTLPARLMAKRIDIYGLVDEASDEPKRLGTVDCPIDASPDERIVIGRVKIDGDHRRVGPTFRVLANEERQFGGWKPTAANKERGHAWLCWSQHSADRTVTVDLLSPNDGGTGENVTGAQWAVGDAVIDLDAPRETLCYLDKHNELSHRVRLAPGGAIKPGYSKASKSAYRELITHHPEMRSCKKIYTRK